MSDDSAQNHRRWVSDGSPDEAPAHAEQPGPGGEDTSATAPAYPATAKPAAGRPSDVDTTADDGAGVDDVAGVHATTTVVTGHADVDDALARLPELDTASTADHVAVFEDVHERLAHTLSELDGG